MKAVKLPSGSWRVQVYCGETADGKKIRKSVTAPTRKEALALAARYVPTDAPMTVAQAVESYIELKEPVLSPATIRSYKTAYRKHIADTRTGRVKLSAFAQVDAQAFVSYLSTELTPKTVKNVYSLLSASVSMYRPDFTARVKMPQAYKRRSYAPQDGDIAQLVKAASGTRLEVPILLAAFCGLRRGEICALTAEDVNRDQQTVVINKAIVKSVGSGYEEKPPKTDESNRLVPVPQFVLDALPTEGPLTDLTIASLTTMFGRLIKKTGLPHFRFHDLRHYYATRLSYMGVPNRINRAINGWATDRVFKSHYEDLALDELANSKTIVLNQMESLGRKLK